MKDLYVLKANQERQLYDSNKVRQAISRAKVPLELHDRAVAYLETNLYDNIPTSEIYQIISRFLTQTSPDGQIRFRLKKAIMDLGPTGYPFEILVGHLLTEHDYETEVGVELMGQCVKHEIDVLATKKNQVHFVECKYHNQAGMRSDIKVVLYVQARGEDLIASGDKSKIYGTWIFTNTSFSTDAATYAVCKKMRLTGWNYPDKKNCLQTMIENKNLYPITVLDSLNSDQRKLLLQQNLVLIKELFNESRVLSQIGLKGQALDKVKRECEQISCF